MNKPTSATLKCGIQTLCIDIFSEILLIASHSSEFGRWEVDDTVFLTPNLKREPCTFMRVCKSWRRVALCTPQLWSHIAVDIGYPDPSSATQKAKCEKEYSRQLNMVFTWLRLSKQTPLLMYLCIYGNKQLPSQMVATIPRWNTLHLVREQIKRETIVPTILQDILPGKANNLERLELSTFFMTSRSELRLKHFPNLKHLKNTAGVTVIPTKSHPLESIRGSLTVELLLKYLHFFSNLKVLHALVSTEGNLPNDRVTSQLETLKAGGRLNPLGIFLYYVTFPALRSADLAIEYDTNNPDDMNEACYKTWISDVLPSFLQRHSANLTKLSLHGDLINGKDARKYLRKTPHLLELDLIITTLEDREVRSIIGCEQDKICPKLNYLELYVREPCKISADTLVQALQSRFSKNKSMTVKIELGCGATVIKQLAKDSRLKKLKKDHALTLELHESEPYSDSENDWETDEEFSHYCEHHRREVEESFKEEHSSGENYSSDEQ